VRERRAKAREQETTLSTLRQDPTTKMGDLCDGPPGSTSMTGRRIIFAALVLGVRWLLSQDKEQRGDSALEILRQRYACGEINKEEFEAKKRDLS